MEPKVALMLRKDSESMRRGYASDILNAQSILDNEAVLQQLGRTQRDLLEHVLKELIKDRQVDIEKAEDDIRFFNSIAQ